MDKLNFIEQVQRMDANQVVFVVAGEEGQRRYEATRFVVQRPPAERARIEIHLVEVD